MNSPKTNPMTPDEFAEAVGRLSIQALNEGIPASSVIGNLEIVKLKVDRILNQAEMAAERKKMAEQILPPNGIKLPRHPGG